MFIEIISVIFICLLSYVFLNVTIKKKTFHNYFNNTKNKIYSIFNSINKLDNSNNKNVNNNINKLSQDDIQNILSFLKSKFDYNHIIIQKNLIFEKLDNEILFHNIPILGFKDNIKTENKISFKFTPMRDNIFISNYNLQNINGYFTLIDNIETKEENNNNESNENNENNKNNENNENNKNINNIIDEKSDDTNDKIQTETIFNYIPDTINITSESEIEIDSIIETTENNPNLYA